MIKAEPTIHLDQVLVGFIFALPFRSLAMQLLFLQENTTKTPSSSELTPEENQHQRKTEDQVGLTISSISVTNSLNEHLF